MYENLSEIAAHEKDFFPGYNVSFLHKISCGYSVLNRYCIYFRTALAVLNCVFYNVFDRYFYLRCIVISKKHLQPYIWVVPSLFQETICSDLVFLRVLPFFEISTFNRLCFKRHWVNSPPVAAIHSTNGPFSNIYIYIFFLLSFAKILHNLLF